jgi:hypothetical protein
VVVLSYQIRDASPHQSISTLFAQMTSENDSDETLTESSSAVMPRPHVVILMFHITLSQSQPLCDIRFEEDVEQRPLTLYEPPQRKTQSRSPSSPKPITKKISARSCCDNCGTSAKAGPNIPDMFSCNPPSVTAERSSWGETISGTIEVQASAANAKPTPIRNREIRMR